MAQVDMAIGIPQPSLRWDGMDPLVDQAPQRSTNEEEINFYYIDPLHELATDTDNAYGYPNKPRVTLPYKYEWDKYAPGTVIEIASDLEKSGAGRKFIAGDGTSASPIFVRGVGEKKVVVGDALYPLGSYIIFENFDLSYDDRGTLPVNSGFILPVTKDGSKFHHVCIRHCIGHGHRSAINISLACRGLDASNRFHDIVYYDNETSHFGHNWRLDQEQDDRHCYHILAFVDYVWIVDCHAYEFAGDGVQLGSTWTLEDPQCPTNVFISNFHSHDNGENAVDIKTVDRVIISGGDFHGFDPTTGVDFQAAVTSIHNYPDRIWMINSKIYDGEDGVALTGCGKSRFIGNTFSNLKRSPLKPKDPTDGYLEGTVFTHRGGRDTAFLNNTCYDYYRGMNLQTTTLDTGAQFVQKNNIWGGRVEAGESDIFVSSSTALADLTLENEACDPNGLGYKGKFMGSEYNSPVDVPFQSGSQYADPMLVHSGGLDNLSIAVGSPCIDSGASIQPFLDEFAAEFSDFGVTIDADQWYNQVQQGAAKDVGAFETGGIQVPMLPRKPINVLADASSNALVWESTSTNVDDFDVLKDGVVVGNVNGNVSSFPVSGIASSLNSYQVVANNAQGAIASDVINSDLLGYTAFPSQEVTYLTDAKSHLLTREYVTGNLGGITINPPTYTGAAYTIANSSALYELNGSSVGNGYNYVTNDNGSISGVVNGSGSCDIIAGVNSYDGGAVSRLQVNSTFIDMAASNGQLAKYKVTLGVDSEKKYTIKPITTNAKHATVLISLNEV